MVHSAVIRAAKVEDSVTLAQLDLEVFPETAFNEKTIEHLILENTSYVAHDLVSEEVQGFLLAKRENNLLDVLKLCVVDKYRRNGIGRALLNAALLTPGDCILTVNRSNEAAMNLYCSKGFKVVGQLQSGNLVLRSTSGG
jgi:ribosomal protein S18 acetylase RimI-like enzyme